MIKKIKKEETTEECKKCVSIDKLSVSFGSEDLNKVVEKINEIIEKSCQ